MRELNEISTPYLVDLPSCDQIHDNDGGPHPTARQGLLPKTSLSCDPALCVLGPSEVGTVCLSGHSPVPGLRSIIRGDHDDPKGITLGREQYKLGIEE